MVEIQMLIENFIPLIPFLANGYSITALFYNKRDNKDNYSIWELFISTLIFSSALFIIPLIISTTWNLNLFFEFIFIFITCGYFFALFWIYKGIGNLVPFLENFSFFPKRYNRFDRLIVYLMLIILISYFSIQLILPERGYDSLLLYLPEGFLFYQLDKIPVFDYLTFYPVFKAPFVTSLYSFVYYTTKGPFFRLIPLMFFFGMFIVAYEFGKEMFHDTTKALIVMLITIITPLTWFIIMLFPFYQDIYIGFFFSCAILFYVKSIIYEESSLFYSLLTGLSIALALSSKVNGWTLFIVIPLLTPIKGNYKIIKLAYCGLLAIFLSFQVATRIFIWFIPLILVIIAFISYLTYSDQTTSKIRYLFLSICMGFILGFHWLYNVMVNIPDSFNEQVFSLYIEIANEIKWNFPARDPTSYSNTFEKVHGIDPIAMLLFFFVGIAFCLGWLLPKIVGLLKPEKIRFSVIWLLGYWVVWFTFHGMGSIRYLTPIIIPMSVLVVHGISQMAEWLKEKGYTNNLTKTFEILSLYYLATTPFSYYYLIPVDPSKAIDSITGLHYDLYVYMASTYTYLSPLMFLLGILIGLLPITLLVVSSSSIRSSTNFMGKQLGDFVRKLNYKKVKRFMVFTIIFVPVVTSVGVYFITITNNQEIISIFADEHDPSYQEVAQSIIDDRKPQTAILNVNVPGMHYFTNQPSLDLYIKHDYVISFLESQNMTKNLDLMLNPHNYITDLKDLMSSSSEILKTQLEKMFFNYFIVPAKGHYWFRHYYDSYLWTYKCFHLLKHESYFTRVLLNDEYALYKAVYNDPEFYGPLNLFISDNIRSASLIELIDTEQSFLSNATLYMEVDQSQITSQPYNLSLLLNYEDQDLNPMVYTQNYTINAPQLTRIPLTGLNSLNSGNIQLNNMSITITCVNQRDRIVDYSFNFISSESESITILYQSKGWYIDYGPGFEIYEQ